MVVMTSSSIIIATCCQSLSRTIFLILTKMVSQELYMNIKYLRLKWTTKMCPWAQKVIFWVLECTLKGSFFGPLSICSKVHLLGHFPSNCALKDPKNDPLSICSRTQKMTYWANAQSLFECMLKDPKNYPVSVCSRTQKSAHFGCTF